MDKKSQVLFPKKQGMWGEKNYLYDSQPPSLKLGGRGGERSGIYGKLY